MPGIKTRLALLCCVLMASGCVENEVNMNNYGFDSNTRKSVAGKTVFFAHQSVGENIISGIGLLQNRNDFQDFITVKEISLQDESGSFTPQQDQLLLLHARVGSNGEPKTKIDHYAQYIERHHKHIQVAVLKLCYVDITANTDLNELFAYYRDTIDRLHRKYPDLQFVHTTVPLVTPDINAASGFKNFVKGLLGKSRRGYEDNIPRNEYNKLLLAEYADNETVFDLAKAEYTDSSGKIHTKMIKGNNVHVMAKEYTYDGGHLNELGQVTAAYHFIKTIGGLK